MCNLTAFAAQASDMEPAECTPSRECLIQQVGSRGPTLTRMGSLQKLRTQGTKSHVSPGSICLANTAAMADFISLPCRWLSAAGGFNPSKLTGVSGSGR